MFSILGISSKHLKIENNASRSSIVILGIVWIEPLRIFQGSPDGWQEPADGARITKPPSPLVSQSTSTPPFSPGRLANFWLPGTWPSLIR